MNEHDGTEQNLGISRRTLLRRGAVVGGTLMWTAPMVKSLTPAAFGATQGPSPGGCSACYCWNGEASGPSSNYVIVSVDEDLGRQNGPPSSSIHAAPGTGLYSRDDCQTFCASQGFAYHQYCTGTTTCRATTGSGPCGGPGENPCNRGVSCD